MDSIFGENLTAYRKEHSYETTLLRLVEECKKKVDDGNLVAVLSTDMSKAFDSLHPALMISKLASYNFYSTAIDLIRTYFINK